MTCYFIFTKLATKDQEQLDAYHEIAAAVLQDHPTVKPLVAYGAQEVFEGQKHEGIVVLEFPDRETALAWYNSPAYRHAREIRLRGGEYQATLVEGIE